MSNNKLPEIVNLKAGPLDVRFTGEAHWCLIHWLPHSGRRGGTLPCIGDACMVHVDRPRWCVLTAGVRRVQRKGPTTDRGNATNEMHANFLRLPEEVRVRLLAEARRGRPDGTYSKFLLEVEAAKIMWPNALQAEQPAEYAFEPIVTDLPNGAALALAGKLDGASWRGNRVLFTRPHVGADTMVQILDRPASCDHVPEPFAMSERMAKHWGISPKRARLTVNEFGQTVLNFTGVSEL